MRIVGPILLNFLIKKLQAMDVLFEETGKPVGLLKDRLVLLCFFHQEVAGDGRALRGDRLALPMRGRDLILRPEGQ